MLSNTGYVGKEKEENSEPSFLGLDEVIGLLIVTEFAGTFVAQESGLEMLVPMLLAAHMASVCLLQPSLPFPPPLPPPPLSPPLSTTTFGRKEKGTYL